ncbi:MAG: hypothetical protein KJT03_24705, partial [Verrucomicrobiae bacterium]|nr:hypothetical protein [Verrucomicrobiae bacterium]
MHRLIPPKVSSLSAYLSALRKQARYSFTKPNLPPGNLSNLYTREIQDQTYLLKEFNSRGPIVKTRMAKFLTICVSGLKRCRQLLLEQGDNLPAVSFELKPIIPHGYLRG